MTVEEHTLTLDGSPVFYLGDRVEPVTPVYLHTSPTSSEDWRPVLELTGGIAPDLMGFGRSGKGGHLDYSPQNLARFVELLLDELGAERIALAGHGWGAAVAAALAARRPERVVRLALLDAAPPLDESAWHGLARWWRRPVLGELLMGSINRWFLGRALRRASAGSEAWPPERVRSVWEHFDQGTQRATLRLHRWADSAGIESIAESLPGLTVPAIVLWGATDPWFSSEQATAWAGRLPDARLEVIEAAGHWPWLDRPEVGRRIGAFLAER